MGNCKGGLVLGHDKLDIMNRDEVKGYFKAMLSIDEDFGYTQIEDILEKAMSGKLIDSVDIFEAIFDEIFNELASQEFWGECDYGIVELDDGQVVICWAIGGHTE